jgi:hypothetical protein
MTFVHFEIVYYLIDKINVKLRKTQTELDTISQNHKNI